MFPLIWQSGDNFLATYTVIFGIAAVLGILFWAYFAALQNLPFEQVISTGIGAVLWGWVGARLLYIISNFNGLDNLEWDLLWQGGIVFYGGFLGALGFSVLSLKRKGLPLVKTMSCAVPGLVLAHALGRLGCFANGCCYGKAANLPWAVTYTDPYSAARPLGIPMHPVQVYEALGLLVLFVFLFIWERGKYHQKFFYFSTIRIYLISYAILRFFLEFLRADPHRGQVGVLSTSQFIAIGILIFAVLLDLSAERGHNRSV